MRNIEGERILLECIEQEKERNKIRKIFLKCVRQNLTRPKRMQYLDTGRDRYKMRERESERESVRKRE